MERVHFETLGCKLNQIETESLAHAFGEAGFSVNPEESAVYRPVGILALNIVNTCTVTGKAEQKARRLIRLLLKKHPQTPVLVTGCYAEVEAAAIAEIDPRVRVFPGSRKGELADLPGYLAARLTLHPEESLLSALSDFCLRAAAPADSGGAIPGTFRLATDNFLFHSRASIKIQDGCDNRCTYCRIRLARGKAVSLPSAEVIDQIKKIETAGWAEAVLSGVNLSQYRSENGDFADLLLRILKNTSTIAIRISSLYPERVDEAILPMLAHPRVRPHFHLSVQSGSDRILGLMKRPYSAETVYRATERLRSVKENPFLACDIITGFPGETDGDFEMTFKLCADIGFAWIHAFPYSPRPGTEAALFKPHIPERIAGERVARLAALAEKNLALYAGYWTGREVTAIVEHGPAGGTGRVLTENYLPIEIPALQAARGTEIRIKLTGNGMGKIVN